MSPRSDLALSDMGSESFVDQSMNFPTVLHGTKKFKFKDVLDVANNIVATAIEEAIDIYVESENVDSGTDSFSEQMVSNIHFVKIIKFKFFQKFEISKNSNFKAHFNPITSSIFLGRRTRSSREPSRGPRDRLRPHAPYAPLI